MLRKYIGYPIMVLLAAVTLFALPISGLNAEILNDDELGSIEIIDISVIEEASGMYTPVGLNFNMTRGGPYRAGDDIYIYYTGQHEKYVSLLDYTPDRKVKPLVMNEHTVLGQGELERSFYGVINEPVGREFVLMIVSNLPLTDEQLEEIALAPNNIDFGDLISSVSVNDFYVVAGGVDPYADNSGSLVRMRDLDSVTGYTGHDPIPLSEMGEELEYPSWLKPQRLWSRVDYYPYPWLVPTSYIEQYGLFSNVYYTIPVGRDIRSSFWNFASSGWIDDGIWFIPPGGYWSAEFEVGDEYYDYYMRILPYIMGQGGREYSHIGISINGNPIGDPAFDVTDAIGWGYYWDYNPFYYYNLESYLRPGVNSISLYWPSDESEDFAFQLVDVLPENVLTGEAEVGE